MTDREFDLKMKSLLGDAEIPAPEGAWEAIRAQIPAVKPVRKAAPWWWAGAGLAAAAAVALALVLGGTFRPADSVVMTEGEAVLAQNETVVPVPETLPEELASVADVTEPAIHPSSPALRVGKKAPQLVLTPKTTEETAQTAGETTGCEAATTTTPSSATPTGGPEVQGLESASTKSSSRHTSSSEKETGERWSDPFARMAYEDAHAKARKPLSFDIRGLVGTNDKATTSAHGGMMAAPAKTAINTASSSAITEEGESRYAVPISVGAGVKFYLSDRWAIGTGIDYSRLTRSFPGYYTKEGTVIKPVNSNIKHTVSYIGIPVNLYYDVVSTSRMKLYGFAGGSLEKGIGQKYTIPGPEGLEYFKQSVTGLQGSAGLGLGVQFNLTDEIGLYVDPSARYYFGANQPKTIRTQQNVMFNLELGVRFDL